MDIVFSRLLNKKTLKKNNLWGRGTDNLSSLDIEKVIYNNPATIVFFTDGTKVVTKTYNEEFDKEKGVAMAVMRKIYSRNEFEKIVKNGIEQVVINEVDEGEVDEDYEFKVGDKVRIVRSALGDGHESNSEIGKCFIIQSIYPDYQYPYDLEGTRWPRRKEELELVEKAGEDYMTREGD